MNENLNCAHSHYKVNPKTLGISFTFRDVFLSPSCDCERIFFCGGGKFEN